MSKSKRVLTLIGDPNKVTTRGGQPFFFLQAGKEKGFLTSGLPLAPEKLRLNRWLWNFWLLIKTGEKGGFQYSETFLKQLFRQADLQAENLEIISYFPLLPPSQWKSTWKVNYYIDATLKQNFEDYSLGEIVSQTIQDQALLREQKNYELAERVICRSRWAAQSVIDDYKISPQKVHVILPGASIDETLIKRIGYNSPATLEPIRLGFIGKDWQRKRLSFILQIADILQHKKLCVEVIVIGPEPKELPTHALIKAMGFINKQNQMERFIKLVQSFHFGCLFSGVEGQGQSILECLRLGVPVLGARAGGIPDSIPEGLGFLFDLNTSALDVANFLESFVINPARYYELRQLVISCATNFTWENTVNNFTKLWQGSFD